ncbi:uncharacterized protein LOC122849493 [Aphidius gifuensis]|uniref:uncharacterized protein LOC122849493 n=1 Tax=Aphidius gifuensis TaxID=684658 RepID=UPI001CDD3411|nr:uncharacterized protein LOC122849493 [Aphidius gifuensis]
MIINSLSDELINSLIKESLVELPLCPHQVKKKEAQDEPMDELENFFPEAGYSNPAVVDEDEQENGEVTCYNPEAINPRLPFMMAPPLYVKKKEPQDEQENGEVTCYNQEAINPRLLFIEAPPLYVKKEEPDEPTAEFMDKQEFDNLPNPIALNENDDDTIIVDPEELIRKSEDADFYNCWHVVIIM